MNLSDGLKMVPLVCVNDEGGREVIGSAIVDVKDGVLTIVSSDMTPESMLEKLLQVDIGPREG